MSVVSLCFLLPRFHLDPPLPSLDGYTFYSVSQEHIVEELDEEARRARAQASKTDAN